MGKRQHQKDKMYLTCTEWSTLYGGKTAATSSSREKEGFRRLPFDHCSLSLQPFEHPLCSPEGHIFDLLNIVPYLKKYGTNPITGQKLDAKSLVKLTFHKNSDGQYHCPVLYKVFNESSHIVAVQTTGNVYSNEAVEQLNLKPKILKDLLDDTPYVKTDLIVLQDPSNLKKFDLSEFHHLKNSLKVEDEEEIKAKLSSTYHLKSISAEAKDILAELNRDYKPPTEKMETVNSTRTNAVADKFNAAHFSTGAVAASFTSTVMEPVTVHQPAVLDSDVVRYRMVKKKGYVRLTTNMGVLNLELFCDAVAKTCENFIGLCAKGYYDNCKFHRSIRNFMLQGGDPTGTGKGGQSLWGVPFQDEFKQHLSHEGRGVMSMANSGPNTNKSQFFITYRSCKHLNKKHTVFGRVVGGFETLDAIEKVVVDDKDRPKTEIRILKADVFVNPYQEVDDKLKADREMEEQQVAKQTAKVDSNKVKAPPITVSTSKKVGKYINLASTKTDNDGGANVIPNKKKRTETTGNFGNFSGW